MAFVYDCRTTGFFFFQVKIKNKTKKKKKLKKKVEKKIKLKKTHQMESTLVNLSGQFENLGSFFSSSHLFYFLFGFSFFLFFFSSTLSWLDQFSNLKQVVIAHSRLFSSLSFLSFFLFLLPLFSDSLFPLSFFPFFFRREVVFPLYRTYKLCQLVLRDTAAIFLNGQRFSFSFLFFFSSFLFLPSLSFFFFL